MAAVGLSFGTKEEYEFRFALFKNRDEKYNQINSEQDSFRVGHNMFSTMTEAEARKMLGTSYTEVDMEPTYFDTSNLEDSLDWRTKGGVNPVKN